MTVLSLPLAVARATLELELEARTVPFGLLTVTLADCPVVRFSVVGDTDMGGPLTVTFKYFVPFLSLTETVVLPTVSALTVILVDTKSALATLGFEFEMVTLPLMLLTVTVEVWPGVNVREEGVIEAACA